LAIPLPAGEITKMQLSFIVCTYNPDLDRLKVVLNSLLEQQKSTEHEIEIIVIDNRSDPPITRKTLNLESAELKIFQEMSPGLTTARLRGSRESTSPMHVFVDDDNIVSLDYADQVLALSNKYPNIGVFSSGSILPDYEVDPPVEIDSYWPYLALKQELKARWANFVRADVLPIGAGMAVREIVMTTYANHLEQDTRRRKTDRDGSSLAAGGDTDIGLVACEINLGCGYFPELKLTHVITKERLKKHYLHRLARDVSYSTAYVVNNSGAKIISKKSLIKEFLIVVYITISNPGKFGRAKRIAARSRFRALRDSLRTQSNC